MNKRSSKRLKTGGSSSSSGPPKKIKLEMTRRQKEAMNSALLNPLILHKIIKSVDFPSLKTCRQINSTWNSISNEKIPPKCCLRLTTIKSRENLSQLNKVLQNNPNFPCHSVILLNEAHFLDSSFQPFLELYGSRIIQLKLITQPHQRRCSNQMSRELFYTLLTCQLPNLESLTLDNFVDFSWPYKSKFYLPNLKYLDIKYIGETAQKILLGSPNLITIFKCGLHDLEAIIRTDKVHTVKNLKCRPPFNSQSLEKFLQKNPRIEVLDLAFKTYDSSLLPSLNLMLEKNKNNLRELALGSTASLNGIQLPKLINLSKLKIGTLKPQPCLPMGLNFRETFPNLRTLDCTHICSDAMWTEYFPDAFKGDLPTVRTLMLEGGSESWLRKIHNLCPNFLHLILNNPRQTTWKTLMNIFKIWSHLESLVLICGNDNYPLGNLDSAFTGFSRDTCDLFRLVRVKGRNERERDYEELIVGPCLSNLKNLRKFHIKLTLYEGDLKNLPISYVTGLYALDLIPHLNLTIDVNSQEAVILLKDQLESHAEVRLARDYTSYNLDLYNNL